MAPDQPAPPPSDVPGRALVVDDEPGLAPAYARLLARAGFTVATASDGKEAVRAVGEQEFDVVITDIRMPQMTGIEFLRAVRARDLDLPIILMTGAPTLQSAREAVELGAFRYLLKPVEREALVEAAQEATRLRQLGRLKREALSQLGLVGLDHGDRAGLDASFERALASLWMAYQPIVDWPNRRVFAHEALLRSDEPTLPNPGAVLSAAERLGRVPELGRVVRARVAGLLDASPGIGDVFVNLHASDLFDDDLSARDSPLTRHAGRVVLEITERAALHEFKGLRARTDGLREIGFRIAIDDLGAGYAGLTSFAQIEPEIVKIDMSLVRGIDRSEIRRNLVGALVQVCRALGRTVVVEGVETIEERTTLVKLGGDLLQGYLFAKPARTLPEVQW
jgi:EAL domain-containing protein (putative c-di-GMP-specific phosphodiesterase class I)